MPDSPTTADQPAPRAKRRRRWLQYSLRSLLIFTAICAVGAGWLARRIEQKRREREAADSLEKRGAQVVYDYQSIYPDAEPYGPAWLRGLLGENFFSGVREVTFRYRDSRLYDADLKDVGMLTSLESLDTWGQPEIGDAALSNLKRLTTLRELSLNGAHITNAGLENLSGMNRLRVLCLDETPVGDEGMSCLAGLTQLENLSLANTKVGDLGMRRLIRLVNLRSLCLSSNEISNDGLVALESMPRLETLCLDDWKEKSKVTDVGLKHLTGLTELKTLSLKDLNITDAGMTHLSGLTRLEYLDLRNTSVGDAGIERVRSLIHLKSLFLNWHCTNECLERIGSFQQLEVLELEGPIAESPMTDEGVAHLRMLPRLRSLTLWGPSFTDAAVRNIVALPKLAVLKLCATRITNAGKSAIQRALPKCVVDSYQ